MKTNEPLSAECRMSTQPLSHHDPEVEQRVQGWLISGRALVWIPILSQKNFPGVPQQVLQLVDDRQLAMRWPISKPEDLLELPDGVTGWLMPADAQDTDVACGLWEGEVFILGVKHSITGKKQTLLGEVPDGSEVPGIADTSSQGHGEGHSRNEATP